MSSCDFTACCEVMTRGERNRPTAKGLFWQQEDKLYSCGCRANSSWGMLPVGREKLLKPPET